MNRLLTTAHVFGVTLVLAACSGNDSAPSSTGSGAGTLAGVGGSSLGSGGTFSAAGASTMASSTIGGAMINTSGNVGGNTGAASGAAGGAASTGGASAGSTTGGKSTAGGSAATAGATTGGKSSTGGGSAVGTPGCGTAAALVSGPATIDVNGVAREYILRVPDNYDPNKPYRLIFAWHQLAGTAQRIVQMGYYGLQSPSANQAILVAPQGLYQITPSSGNLDAGWWNNNGEDVNFYHAMLNLFESKLCIDQNRIFSVGFSFGAMFSFTLACSADSQLRAIAPQAGSSSRCTGTRPVAVMGFVGTDDSLMTGHLQGMSTFAQRDGCSTETVTVSPSWCDGLASSYQPCSCVQYTNCTSGYPVISCTYKNGHMFAPNSGQVIWDFFSQF